MKKLSIREILQIIDEDLDKVSQIEQLDLRKLYLELRHVNFSEKLDSPEASFINNYLLQKPVGLAHLRHINIPQSNQQKGEIHLYRKDAPVNLKIDLSKQNDQINLDCKLMFCDKHDRWSFEPDKIIDIDGTLSTLIIKPNITLRYNLTDPDFPMIMIYICTKGRVPFNIGLYNSPRMYDDNSIENYYLVYDFHSSSRMNNYATKKERNENTKMIPIKSLMPYADELSVHQTVDHKQIGECLMKIILTKVINHFWFYFDERFTILRNGNIIPDEFINLQRQFKLYIGLDSIKDIRINFPGDLQSHDVWTSTKGLYPNGLVTFQESLHLISENNSNVKNLLEEEYLDLNKISISLMKVQSDGISKYFKNNYQNLTLYLVKWHHNLHRYYPQHIKNIIKTLLMIFRSDISLLQFGFLIPLEICFMIFDHLTADLNILFNGIYF